MKFILFVEGKTEKKAIPDFIKRWLDARLSQSVRITPVKFEGNSDFYNGCAKKAQMYLDGNESDKIIGVIGLLDLYGFPFYPKDKSGIKDRFLWGKKYFEKEVARKKFRMFFAIHETEAWLFSNPNLFPSSIRKAFPGKAKEPETINFNLPPAKLLDKLFSEKTKRGYKKVTQGKELFDQLDPNVAYDKCPYFKALLDEMLKMAKETGL